MNLFLHKSYCFTDVATGDKDTPKNPFSRNHVCDVRQLPEFSPGADAYTGMFRFKKEYLKLAESTGTVSGADKFAAWSDYLWLDVDNKDDLAAALDDAKRLIRELQTAGALEFTVVYFTGCKGFCIGIESRAFGFTPSVSLPDDMRNVADYLAKTLHIESIDLSIYNHNRLWRVPNTVNSKLGYLKTKLEVDKFLDCDLEEILSLASPPCTKAPEPAMSDKMTVPVNPILQQWFAEIAVAKSAVGESWNEPVNDTVRFRELDTKRLEIMLATPEREGNRDNVGIMLAVQFNKLGRLSEAESALTAWATLCGLEKPNKDAKRWIKSASSKSYEYGKDFSFLSEADAQARVALGLPLAQASNLDELLVTGFKQLPIISPGQDFENGVLYFGVEVGQKEPWFVTSNRNAFPFSKAKEYGVQPRRVITQENRFSRDGIIAFRNGKKVSTFELYTAIHKYLTDFFFFLQPEQAHYLALWCLGSYVFQIFHYYPYAWLNAEQGSGKTTLLSMVSQIAFNATMTGDRSKAFMFRLIDGQSNTLLLDEVENMANSDVRDNGDLLSIIREGFRKTGTVGRCEGERFERLVQFHVYGPKMFAGIASLETALRDRIHKITLQRCKQNEKAKRYAEGSPALVQRCQNIRDNCYIWALTHCQEVSELANSQPSCMPSIMQLHNRELDLWLPILVLCELIEAETGNGTLTSMMLALAKESHRMKRYEDSNNGETAKLLMTLHQMVTDTRVPRVIDEDSHVFVGADVFAYFSEQDEFAWFRPQHRQYLSTAIRKLGFTTRQQRVAVRGTTKTNPKRVYVINLAHLADLIERQGLNVLIENENLNGEVKTNG